MGTLTKVSVEQEQAVERKAKVMVMSSSLSTALIVELSIFKLVMILVVFCQREVFSTSEKQQCEVFYFTLTSLWPHFQAVSESSLYLEWPGHNGQNLIQTTLTTELRRKAWMCCLLITASFHVYFCSILLIVIFCTFAHITGCKGALQTCIFVCTCF